MKSALLMLVACLGFATPVSAQQGRGGRPPASRGPSRPPPRSRPAPPPAAPLINLSDIVAVGVVRSVDKVAGRITLSYEAIEGLNWPAGTMPFAVSKTALLDGVSVGDKVSFKLESQQITRLQVSSPRPAPVEAAARASPKDGDGSAGTLIPRLRP